MKDVEKVRELLRVLAREMKEDKFETTFDDYFENFLDPQNPIENKDLSRHLNQYLADILEENSPLVLLLKGSSSQGIVSPAWVWLKLDLLQDFPFKDGKLGWKVHVIFSENYISIIHRKHEQGYDDDLELLFSFFWELKLNFDRQASTIISTAFGITQLTLAAIENYAEKCAAFKKLFQIGKNQLLYLLKGKQWKIWLWSNQNLNTMDMK